MKPSLQEDHIAMLPSQRAAICLLGKVKSSAPVLIVVAPGIWVMDYCTYNVPSAPVAAVYEEIVLCV